MTRTLLALACTLGLGACFGDGNGGGGPNTAPPMVSGTGPTSGDAKLFIDWTVAGAAPSDSACSGVDHLELDLFYDQSGSLEISPIPCALTRFRYDDIPSGTGTVQLTAFDANGCTTASGSAGIQLSSVLPASPGPTVPIAATGRCP